MFRAIKLVLRNEKKYPQHNKSFINKWFLSVLPFKDEVDIITNDEVENLRKDNRILRKKIAMMEISSENRERFLREDRAKLSRRMRDMEETFDREITGHEKVRKHAEKELKECEKRMEKMKKEMRSLNSAYNFLDESYEHTIESYKDDIARLKDKLNAVNLKLKNVEKVFQEKYEIIFSETVKEYHEDLRICEEELYRLSSVCKKCSICSKEPG